MYLSTWRKVLGWVTSANWGAVAMPGSLQLCGQAGNIRHFLLLACGPTNNVVREAECEGPGLQGIQVNVVQPPKLTLAPMKDRFRGRWSLRFIYICIYKTHKLCRRAIDYSATPSARVKIPILITYLHVSLASPTFARCIVNHRSI